MLILGDDPSASDALLRGASLQRGFDPESVDVEWCRRPGLPQISADALHPADLTVVRKQAEHFGRAFWMTLRADSPGSIRT